MSICSSLTPAAVPPASTMGFPSLQGAPVAASVSQAIMETPVKTLSEEVRLL